MIDVVTVVYGSELPILSCQAQSLDIYCQDLGINNVFVMVNEHNLRDQIDVTWYGSLAPKVRIIPREFFPVRWCHNGWINQQLCKILASSLSLNPWSMILDAKTVITAELTLPQLMTDQGQLRMGWIPTAEVFEPAQQIANRLFDCSNQQTLQPAGVPFFFHNHSIRSMIDWIESKLSNDFGSWFLDQGCLTEFVLYSTWVSIDSGRRELYADHYQPGVLDICHVCHNFTDQFDQILAKHNDQSHTLSVHQRAWARLEARQKIAFRDRLLARGINRAAGLV